MPLVILAIGVVVVIGVVGFTLLTGQSEDGSNNEPEFAELPVDDDAFDRDEGLGTQVAVEEDEVSALPTTPPTDLPTKIDDAAVSTINDSPTVVSDTDYQNGTYVFESSYTVPSGHEEPIRVSLTLNNDIVTDADVQVQGVVGTSRLYQGKFLKAYEAEIEGKDIDDLSLSRVGGSSLTTGAFNKALLDIKIQASS